jgi:hypothetical protein
MADGDDVDDVDDRLSKRFDGPDADTSQNAQNAQNDTASQNAQNDMSSSTSQNESAAQKVKNIKKEWNVRSFYLNDELNDELVTAFKRLDLELDEADVDLSLKKTRHFYPLVVELGLERMEGMDVSEITERLEK